MPQHPALTEFLAQERIAELHRTAEISAWRRRQAAPPRLVHSARRATGWFLVDLGLRLASPRGLTRSA